MSTNTIVEQKQKDSDNKDNLYLLVKKTIQAWPEWKRNTYNNDFAIANGANKY